MSALHETAYAKLNLALHVRGREPNGYHAIETLFAFCEDGDGLTLTAEPGLKMSGPFAAAIGEGGNLVTRAAAAFAERFGTAPAGFALDKQLPVAAGIGGGSADAAAALRLLCRREGIELAAVDDIAAGLGADVPACLGSTLARGEGRGDRLVPLASPLTGLPALLVNPREALATGPVFAAWDGIDRGPLQRGNALAAAVSGRNDLEAPAHRLCPAIGAVLTLLRAQRGVMLARMSGSGATCLALFGSPQAQAEADAAVAAARPEWWRLATRLR